MSTSLPPVSVGRLVTLGLAVLLPACAACRPGERFISSADKEIELRLVATQTEDNVLLNTTEELRSGVLAQDGEILARWLPIDPSSPAFLHIELLSNAITRTTDTGIEVLVLHRDGDISSAKIESMTASGRTDAGQPRVSITLGDKASKDFYRFTLENTVRNLAIIADGKVRAVPAIAAPVLKDVVLTPTRVDKVRLEPRSDG